MRALISLSPLAILVALAIGLTPAGRAVTSKPDYSGIVLKGNGMKQDHLSLTVEAAADDTEQAPQRAYPRSASLDDVPVGGGASNDFAQGLAVALRYCGTPADYNTLMGDLGVAFIMQASEEGPFVDGALDAGWWPLAAECLPTYLDFVEQTTGRRIHYLTGDDDEYKTDAAKHYRDTFESDVKASIADARPVLAKGPFWKLITGYDEEERPLLAHCPSMFEKQTIRLEQYPWTVVTLGPEIPRLDRKTADLEALRHAVALGRDRVPMPGGYLTGQKAFALWIRTLRDTEHLGQSRWHANVCLHLHINRRAAVTYLWAMSERHPGGVATRLNAAADLYEQVLERVKGADARQEAMMSEAGREKLALLAEDIADLEAQAIAEIEEALAAAG
ncbi:MAG: hypothetical protein ACE5JM_17130 [Armatimonadota bacterium]